MEANSSQHRTAVCVKRPACIHRNLAKNQAALVLLAIDRIDLVGVAVDQGQVVTLEHDNIPVGKAVDFFENKTSLEEVKELIKQNSRHYAKRQLTWFRREKEVSWINYPEFNYSKDEILKYMTDKIKEKGII